MGLDFVFCGDAGARVGARRHDSQCRGKRLLGSPGGMKAPELVSEMLAQGLESDIMTYTAAVGACEKGSHNGTGVLSFFFS